MINNKLLIYFYKIFYLINKIYIFQNRKLFREARTQSTHVQRRCGWEISIFSGGELTLFNYKLILYDII